MQVFAFYITRLDTLTQKWSRRNISDAKRSEAESCERWTKKRFGSDVTSTFFHLTSSMLSEPTADTPETFLSLRITRAAATHAINSRASIRRL
jgi:hypothetical protein